MTPNCRSRSPRAATFALRSLCGHHVAGAQQVDLTGSAAVGTAALQQLRPFALRELRVARIWTFKVKFILLREIYTPYTRLRCASYGVLASGHSRWIPTFIMGLRA